jgi:hypothetical protein
MAKISHPHQEQTIHDLIALARVEEERQSASFLEECRQRRAAGSPPLIDATRPNHEDSFVRTLPGTVQTLTGWRRNGQGRGRPGIRLPIQCEVEAMRENYFDLLKSAEPSTTTNKILAARSVQVRRVTAVAPQICCHVSGSRVARCAAPSHSASDRAGSEVHRCVCPSRATQEWDPTERRANKTST